MGELGAEGRGEEDRALPAAGSEEWLLRRIRGHGADSLPDARAEHQTDSGSLWREVKPI